jgi:glycosyltransferase involved in cell wall biosynthesis
MHNPTEVQRSITTTIATPLGTATEGKVSEVTTGTVDRVLMVTWLDHQRTRQLCAGLGFDLAVMTTRYRGLARYLLLSARTLTLLWRLRPRVLIVQNPSMVLAALAVLLRTYFGFRLIVDAHNAAIAPFAKRPWLIARLSRWLLRKADLTLVTNRQLADIVVEQHGRPFILPDRIPVPPTVSGRRLRTEFTVALIATFAADEPIAEVFEAVQGTDTVVYVTGDHRKMSREAAAKVSANVEFCGFLPDTDYWTLLASVDAVVDLTRTQHCLVCGAYEALAIGKPMLLSRSSASVELFGESALYTDNNPTDIRQQLARLSAQAVPLRAAVASGRSRLQRSWRALATELTRIVADWAAAKRETGG